MAMRWGSANVLSLHEGVGLAADREKGLTASARRLDLEAQFNASGYSIVGLQETRCRREGDRRGRHYYMIGTAASDIGQGGCELWITTKLNPGKSSITVTAHSHRWLAVDVELPKFSAAVVDAHEPPEVGTELVRKQWWEELSQIVLGMAPRSGQVWLLIDANGRLGGRTQAQQWARAMLRRRMEMERRCIPCCWKQVCMRQTHSLRRERRHGSQRRGMDRV